jgi:cobalamin biosynthesis protein CbiD
MTMNVQVDEGIVKPIIEAQVKAAILAGLDGKADKLLVGVIEHLLKQKVNSEGKVANYGNNYDLLELLTHRVIKEVAEEVLREFVQSKKDEIRKAMEKEIARRPQTFAKMMIEGMEECVKFKWMFNCTIDSK